MFNLPTSSIDQTIPLYSIRLIEAHRIFNLIQQNIEDPKPALTTRNIENFIQRFYFDEPGQKAAKIMYELNKEGLQMNDQKFAISLAKRTKEYKLTTDESLNYFYKKIKDFLALNHQNRSEAFQKWDIDQMTTNQNFAQRVKNVAMFYNETQPYIEGMQIFTFQNYLERINYCLSAMSFSVNQIEIFNIVKAFINPTVMTHTGNFLAGVGPLQNQNQAHDELISSIISQSDNVTRYFALLSHFYQACKYRQLKQKLQGSPFLFYHETFKSITCSLTIFHQKIQKQVAVCLAFLAKYVQTFNDWILSNIEQNFVPMLGIIGLIKDEPTLYYIQICLKYIIKNYQKKQQIFKHEKTLSQIQQFCFYLLKTTTSIELQQQCLILIGEIMKVCSASYKTIQQIRMITKVFEAQIQYQSALVPATLSILEVSIQKHFDDVTNVIINDVGFLNAMNNHLGVRQSIFYYQFLHVVYLLSYRHSKFLIEKGILDRLTKLLSDELNPSISSIGCDVFFNIVQQSLQNQQILHPLYERFYIFENIIPLFIKKCFEKTPYVDLFMSIENQNNFLPAYAYFDKYMLLTVFKILYCLAVGISRKNKKYAFSRRLNEQIIKSISMILDFLFRYENRRLIEIILRQKIKILNNKKIKLENGISLYKVINIILQEMTYNSQNKSHKMLCLIDREIKSYGENLLKSEFFTPHELQVQNIAIYIKLEIYYQDQSFKRSIPHKFQLSSIKTYMKTFVVNGVDTKITDVRDIIIRQKNSTRFIQNQVQYRSIVNKALENMITTFEWQIVDVKWKNRRQDLTSSFVGTQHNNDSHMRTMREPTMFAGRQTSSRYYPNIQTSRFTTLRQHPTNHDSRRLYHSPININYSYRDKSPAFGGSGGNRNS